MRITRGLTSIAISQIETKSQESQVKNYDSSPCVVKKTLIYELYCAPLKRLYFNTVF